MYYYGCFKSVGHYLVTESGRFIIPEQASIPWKIEEMEHLCPAIRYYADEIEGRAALHHKAGWTALAFWDRSIDDRYGSKSVFFIKGEFDFDAMIEAAQKSYSSIWNRFKFEVKLFIPTSEEVHSGGHSGGGRTANLMEQASSHPDAKIFRRSDR